MKKSTKIWIIVAVTLIVISITLIILIKTQQINMINQAPFFESNWHKITMNPDKAGLYS